MIDVPLFLVLFFLYSHVASLQFFLHFLTTELTNHRSRPPIDILLRRAYTSYRKAISTRSFGLFSHDLVVFGNLRCNFFFDSFYSYMHGLLLNALWGTSTAMN
jgi:hypothetical protein